MNSAETANNTPNLRDLWLCNDIHTGLLQVDVSGADSSRLDQEVLKGPP
jgi:hypothetical protein